MYPEFVLKPEETKAFLVDRQGAVVGRKLADQYGWKVGDQIPLRGTIYPGHVDVHAARHLRRRRRQDRRDAVLLPLGLPERDDQGSASRGAATRSASTSSRSATRRRPPRFRSAIDATFKNSLAETLTETEKAFQLGFVAMTEAILVAIQAVSFVVIVIIMAVMANTMAMTARERYAEYATMKALGFAQRLRRAC